MNKRKVLILSAIDPTRAYSCIKYLYFELKKSQIYPECWCRVPETSMDSYKKWGDNVYSYCSRKIFQLPKIRTWYMKWIGIVKALKYRNQTIICHDLFHYKTCSIIKKLFPNTKLILYFTEIYNEKHSEYLYKLQRYFENHPNEMNLMIECDYKREEYRVKKTT